MRVMITGCSKHSKELIDCLKQNEDGRRVEVTAVNMDSNKLLRHGPDYCHVVPPITDERYIDILLAICKEHDINIIIPYITAELELMARNKYIFEREGIKVSVADAETVERLNNKAIFYEFFSDYMPPQIEVKTRLQAIRALEVMKQGNKKTCCKISGKCGGTGFCILDEEKCHDISLFNRCGVNRYISREELLKILDTGKHSVILQEYIEGTDYSVCVLANHGKVERMVGYAGYDMEFGAVVNGQILYNQEAYQIVEKIVSETGFDGNACFDFILDGPDPEFAKPYLLECNPRINASIGFCWNAGVNLVYLRCKQLLGEEIGPHEPVIYGMRMQKYYESEYYI